MSSVFDELLSEVRDVAAPEHKLPNRSKNNTTSGQVLGNSVTVHMEFQVSQYAKAGVEVGFIVGCVYVSGEGWSVTSPRGKGLQITRKAFLIPTCTRHLSPARRRESSDCDEIFPTRLVSFI